MSVRLSHPVMVMAGGTGGHIFPGLAVADVLRQRHVDVVWLGSKAGLENDLVPARGLPLETLAISGLRGKSKLTLIVAPFRLMRAIWQAIAVLRRHRPRSVLSMGGFAAAPGGIAAWLLRCPLVVHEQNQIPGLTNRLLAPLAKRILGGFPNVFPSRLAKRFEHVGNPVRKEIADLSEPALRLRDRAGPIRLLVLGGSQGARAINQTLPLALAQMDPLDRPTVWHQLGRADHVEGVKRYQSVGIEARLDPFIDNMAQAYEWADLVLCRSGALTLAELAAAGMAAILVPFPHAVDDHQTANGRYLVEVGAAVMLQESELNVVTLAALLAQLGADREGLLAMAQKARSQARRDAAEQVAMACLEVAID